MPRGRADPAPLIVLCLGVSILDRRDNRLRVKSQDTKPVRSCIRYSEGRSSDCNRSHESPSVSGEVRGLPPFFVNTCKHRERKVELDLEARKCRHCGKGFKCLATSKIDYCSSECAKKSGLWSRASWGNRGEGSVRSMTVSGTAAAVKTQSSDEKKASVERDGPKQTQSLPGSDQKPSTGEAKPKPTLERPSGSEKIESTSNNTGENTMQKIKSASSLASLPSATEETLPESFDGSQRPLEKVALDSMKLLQKSGNKLMQLIDESVSAEDLEKSADGAVRVAGHKIEIAIHAANTLAQTVQTQVNMVKAYTDLKRHLEK